jgi:two-component sensor histidine kinase
MTDNAALILKLLRQQAAIATFGSFALRQTDLMSVLTEAARVCAVGLDVPYSKVCRYRVVENDLVIEAGYGWNRGVIGYVVPHPDDRTPQGVAFTTGLPLICNFLNDESAFILPPFYAEHGIVSTIDVLIKGDGRPYGVLEIDSDQQREFDQHDIDFLTGFANVLGEAVATAERTKILKITIDRMALLVKDKDILLDQKKVMAEELQHRVRNNLQLVCGLLTKQLGDTTDEVGQRGLRAITRRVYTLSQVYDQLLGTEMTRSIDFNAYLKALCANLSDVQAPADGSIRVRYEGAAVMLDLDVVTALGIVAAELVTNSFEHAFAGGGGQIGVSLLYDSGGLTGTMMIRDSGCGFTPMAGSKRHGVGLVNRLCEQAGGSATVEIKSGTLWTISFPVDLDFNPHKNTGIISDINLA